MFRHGSTFFNYFFNYTMQEVIPDNLKRGKLLMTSKKTYRISS